MKSKRIGFPKPYPSSRVITFHGLLLGRAEANAVRHTPGWVVKIVVETARSHDVLVAAIMGKSTKQKIVRARHEAICRIKEKQPTISSPKLGEYFGRAGSTMLFAMAKHASRVGEPPMTGYKLQKRESTGRPVGRPRKSIDIHGVAE